MAETISKPEAAIRAGKTTKTIGNWIRAGHIKASRDADGVQVVDVASLDAYLESQRKVPATFPEGAKGLAELVSLLEKEQERNDRLQKRNTDLEWENGRLMGEIRALKDRPVPLLESGEAVPSAEETPAETLPDEPLAWWDLPARIRRSRWYTS